MYFKKWEEHSVEKIRKKKKNKGNFGKRERQREKGGKVGKKETQGEPGNRRQRGKYILFPQYWMGIYYPDRIFAPG